MSDGKMTENNFMVENWTSLPEGLVSNITTYVNGCEGWRRLKQCGALRELHRKWKPSIYIEQVGESKYYVEICNKCLKGNKALSYVFKTTKRIIKINEV